MEYSIIKLNGKQYIINKGSLMKLDRVDNDTLVEVLMHGDEKNTLIGSPVLEGFGVKFEILEDKKDKKISVRRFKSKSKYRKEKGHRQPISIVKVVDFGKGIKTGFSVSTRSLVVEDISEKAKESNENDTVISTKESSKKPRKNVVNKEEKTSETKKSVKTSLKDKKVISKKN